MLLFSTFNKLTYKGIWFSLRTKSGGSNIFLPCLMRMLIECSIILFRLRILGVLKSFKGDKSLGPYEWIAELFTHFFYLSKQDIVDMVEESRVQGFTHPHINSTYIALILKMTHSLSFSDFRPISLCNLVYKIISKSIANRMRHALSMYISL